MGVVARTPCGGRNGQCGEGQVCRHTRTDRREVIERLDGGLKPWEAYVCEYSICRKLAIRLSHSPNAHWGSGHERANLFLAEDDVGATPLPPQFN